MSESLFRMMAAREPEHWWYRARRELLFHVVRRHVARDAPLLDLGCGTGWVLARIADWCEAWGLDPSPENVARCHARGLHRVAAGTVERLPTLPQAYFAAVCFLDVLEHLDDDREALELARRALRPEGVVLVTVPAYRWLWSSHDRLHRHRRRYTAGELRALLDRTGYDVVRLTYFNTLLLPFAILARVAQRALGAPSLDMRVPPPLANRALERLFLAERHLLLRGTSRRYIPAGLSILAVARARATVARGG